MASSTAEYAQGGSGTGRPQQRLTFLSAPFSGRTWRESLHLLVNLPVGILSFTLLVTFLSFGFGMVLTFVGLPLLAATVAGSRGLGAMERARAVGGLGLDAPAPAPLSPSRPGMMGWIRAALTSWAGWRSVLYGLLMLPVGIASFTVTITLWSCAIGYASYPLWQWVFPHYAHVPGLQLYTDDGHTVYLHSVPAIAGTCAVGLLLLFATPWVVRGMANVQRLMVRGLLT